MTENPIQNSSMKDPVNANLLKHRIIMVINVKEGDYI